MEALSVLWSIHLRLFLFIVSLAILPGQRTNAQQVPPIVIPIVKERVPYYIPSEDGKGVCCGVYLYGSYPVYKGQTNITDYTNNIPGLTITPGKWYLDTDGRFRFYATFSGACGPIQFVDCSPTTVGETLPEWYAEYPPKPPRASFTSIAVPGEPDARNFQSTSTDPENDPLTERWEFGDGDIASGTGVYHRYTRPGNFNVALTVTDTDTLTNRTSRTISVPAPALTVSLQIISKHSGNRIEPNETFRVRATVSAGDSGVGDLSDVAFTGQELTVPSNLAMIEAPADTLIGTLQPGQKRAFEWVLQATGLGDFTLTTAALTGMDAAIPSRSVFAPGASEPGSVTALIAGIKQLPERVVLGEDNNGDGIVNADDMRVKIIVGVTNVANVDVTEVRTDNLNEPIKLITRLPAPALGVALEPVGAHSGDFGTIAPGADNAVVRTNIYLATNYV